MNKRNQHKTDLSRSYQPEVCILINLKLTYLPDESIFSDDSHLLIYSDKTVETIVSDSKKQDKNMIQSNNWFHFIARIKRKKVNNPGLLLDWPQPHFSVNMRIKFKEYHSFMFLENWFIKTHQWTSLVNAWELKIWSKLPFPTPLLKMGLDWC